jgi:hypothetical protein
MNERKRKTQIYTAALMLEGRLLAYRTPDKKVNFVHPRHAANYQSMIITIEEAAQALRWPSHWRYLAKQELLKNQIDRMRLQNAQTPPLDPNPPESVITNLAALVILGRAYPYRVESGGIVFRSCTYTPADPSRVLTLDQVAKEMNWPADWSESAAQAADEAERFLI